MASPTWSWQEVGFRKKPKRRASRPGERLFRAWGGESSTMRGRPNSVGVCFSSVAPKSRWDAERLFAVFEYGNPCTHVTEFVVPENTMMWEGEVDPGDARVVLGMSYGPQIFIENPLAQSLIPCQTTRLPDDLGHHRLHWHQGRDA